MLILNVTEIVLQTLQCYMLLLDASIISLKVWPQAVTSLWGWNWLSCISRVNNLEQYEILNFLLQNALFDLWLKVRWPAWLLSLSEFHQKKNRFLSQWPWIKASYDKRWRGFTVQKALPNRSVVKQLPWCPLHPTKVIYFWCLFC